MIGPISTRAFSAETEYRQEHFANPDDGVVTCARAQWRSKGEGCLLGNGLV